MLNENKVQVYSLRFWVYSSFASFVSRSYATRRRRNDVAQDNRSLATAWSCKNKIKTSVICWKQKDGRYTSSVSFTNND